MKYLLILLLFVIPAAPALADLPYLGEPSQQAITPEQERQIGQQAMFQIRAEPDYLRDSEVGDYINWLGDKLVSNSSEPGLGFEFAVLHDADINAFALPGGFICVNTGLILTAQTESELAAVLSHEIAHVTQHHYARMLAGQKYDSLIDIVSAAVALLASRDNPNAIGAVTLGPGYTLQRQLKFTREHEEEADRVGLGILEKSGFDPHAMPIFFKRLEMATRLFANNMPSWMLTHPITPDRLADIQNRLRGVPFKLVPDSLDFELVQSKLLVMNKKPDDAVKYFHSALYGARKFGNPVAQRYGLAWALYQDGKYAEAKKELVRLLKEDGAASDPMVQTLAGRIYAATGMSLAKLDAFYNAALQDHPSHRALSYDYAGVLTGEKQYNKALKLLDTRIADFPNDARLYEIQAKVYALLNRPQEEHHALAYAYISHGNLMAAIEQLVLARQAGNDYYQITVIDNELRQFRAMAEALRKKK